MRRLLEELGAGGADVSAEQQPVPPQVGSEVLYASIIARFQQLARSEIGEVGDGSISIPLDGFMFQPPRKEDSGLALMQAPRLSVKERPEARLAVESQHVRHVIESHLATLESALTEAGEAPDGHVSISSAELAKAYHMVAMSGYILCSAERVWLLERALSRDDAVEEECGVTLDHGKVSVWLGSSAADSDLDRALDVTGAAPMPSIRQVTSNGL
eukprot:gene3895-4856_t